MILMNNTTEFITYLKPNQVFVFGSNLAGRHGLGAAKHAVKFGAVYGIGKGMTGQCYAIPTKDKFLNILPLSEIQKYCEEFIIFAENKPNLEFLVTKIGCGLAGYQISDISVFFKNVPNNVILPIEFR